MRRHRIFLIVLRNAVSIRQAVSFRLQFTHNTRDLIRYFS